MGTLWQDVKFGLRTLSRAPGFALVAVLTLALGIGANTAIFSVVNGVLLRPLAYEQPGRLYLIREVIPQMQKFYPSLAADLPDFQIWQKRVHSFEGIALAEPTSADLTGGTEPEEIHGVRSSANLFDVLGVRPALGRSFLPEEDETGHGHVVILSNEFWRSRFHADSAILGKTMTLDGAPYTIVGVMPPTFHFPQQVGQMVIFPENISFFEPLNGPKEYETDLIGEFDFAAIGRLAPGVTPKQALAELNVVQAQIAKQANEGVDLLAEITPLENEIVGSARRGLLFLLLAVGAVLLIACVNLANLLLARVPGRMREAAIRTALGATRTQLARRMLVESLLLGLAGGVLGVGLAWIGVHWLVQAAPPGIPRINEVTIDARVLGFAAALGILTGALFGLLPAWRIAHAEPMDALKSGSTATTESRRTRRVRDSLVGVEVGLSTVLLILAGLLTASLFHVLHVNTGFSPENVLAAGVDLPPQSYDKPETRLQFYRDVLARLRTVPGVRQAGWVSLLPLTGQGSVTGISVPGSVTTEVQAPPANYRAVSPGYFPAMGIRLLEGRIFTESDRGRNVVVVSQSVAERFWPGQNPIGKTCLAHWGPQQAEQVIGVVSDIRTVKLDRPPVMMVYVPDWFGWIRPANTYLGVPPSASFVVRTAMNPAGAAQAVREAIHAADPEVPIVSLRPMTEIVSSSVDTRRFEMFLAGVFGVFALFLAALGIAGVVAYSVEQRRQELAIRMALGARLSDLRRMVLRQGMAPVVAGLAAGVVVAIFAGRLIESLLFGVRAFDPLTTAAVASAVIVIGLAACIIPARRATRVDPIVSLRQE
ncbi:MAG: ABC transporter permease [Acidobacteriota bacterium]|nr:ABC transporter permease [Acidobacteriota bacterium]